MCVCVSFIKAVFYCLIYSLLMCVCVCVFCLSVFFMIVLSQPLTRVCFACLFFDDSFISASNTRVFCLSVFDDSFISASNMRGFCLSIFDDNFISASNTRVFCLSTFDDSFISASNPRVFCLFQAGAAGDISTEAEVCNDTQQLLSTYIFFKKFKSSFTCCFKFLSNLKHVFLYSIKSFTL